MVAPLLALVAVAGSAPVADRVPDRYVPAEPERVALEGLLGARARVNLERRLLAMDEARLLAPFRARAAGNKWAGEHVGKFLDDAAEAYRTSHDARLRVLMDRVAHGLIETQLPDYLGTCTPEARWTSWDVWVHKYDVIGLLAHHRATGDAASLAAARRIGELLMRTFGEGPGQRDILAAGEHE